MTFLVNVVVVSLVDVALKKKQGGLHALVGVRWILVDRGAVFLDLRLDQECFLPVRVEEDVEADDFKVCRDNPLPMLIVFCTFELGNGDRDSTGTSAVRVERHGES